MAVATTKGPRGIQSRRELTDVAIDCFARYGYQATSIDRIAKAAGVTKGALYYHFKDKEDLLFQAVSNRVGQFERRVASDVADIRDAAETLRQVTQACLDHATKSNHRRFIVTLMVEALETNAGLSKQFREMMQRFRSFLADVVAAGQRAGAFRPDIDGATAAQIYAAAVMGAEIQYYQDPEGIDLVETLETFVNQFIAWLSAAADTGNGGHRKAITTARRKP